MATICKLSIHTTQHNTQDSHHNLAREKGWIGWNERLGCEFTGTVGDVDNRPRPGGDDDGPSDVIKADASRYLPLRVVGEASSMEKDTTPTPAVLPGAKYRGAVVEVRGAQDRRVPPTAAKMTDALGPPIASRVLLGGRCTIRTGHREGF